MLLDSVQHFICVIYLSFNHGLYLIFYNLFELEKINYNIFIINSKYLEEGKYYIFMGHLKMSLNKRN